MSTGNDALSKQIDNIEEKVERIDYTLHGNGATGLKTIVDRHTQSLGVLSKGLWVVVVAVVGVIVASLL